MATTTSRDVRWWIPPTIGVLVVLAHAMSGARTTLARAQTPANATFEVASVKENRSASGSFSMGTQPGGRFAASNVTLLMLVRNAYSLQPFQIVGGPDWIDSLHFDVVAKAAGDATSQDVLRMMQALLTSRFKLSTHRETREQPSYALVLARQDGRLGPQIKRSTMDCAAVLAGIEPPRAQTQGARPVCGVRMSGKGTIAAGGVPLDQLASALSNTVGRSVTDHTGLTGGYDFDVSFTPEQVAPTPTSNNPSLFTALTDQLGLKLEPSRGPVQVLVIDRAERPTPD